MLAHAVLVLVSAQLGNAFDDYAKAAEILWTNREQFTGTKQLGPRRYEVTKNVVQRFSVVYDWIASGNLKQYAYPESPPELTKIVGPVHIILLTDAIQRRAYVRFADGNPNGGLDDLILGLRFCNNVRNGRVQELSSSQGLTVGLLGTLEDYLPAISLAGARKVHAQIKPMLTQPSRLREILERHEKRYRDRFPNEFVGVVASLVGGDEPTTNHELGMKRLHTLSERELFALRSAVLKGIDDVKDWAVNCAGSLDKHWLPSPVESLTGMEHDIVAGITDYHTIELRAEVRYRIALRLASLSSKVVEYRWLNGKLPETLAALEDEAFITDPFTGVPFIYEKTGAANFVVYSKGNKVTGPIYLKTPKKP